MTEWEVLHHHNGPKKYHVVGGGAVSVAVIGGYLQGGGHSPLAPAFGLAADHLLAATVVTPEGHVLEVRRSFASIL